MQDKFYADNRDLVKWAILHRLAEIFDARRILQIAFYRPGEFALIKINGIDHDIPQEILTHFRDMRKIENIDSKFRVNVFGDLFKNRDSYLGSVKAFLSKFSEERCIVFLDPDIGLEPQHPTLDHVLESEAKTIWEDTKSGDVYVLYQHRFFDRNWVELKRSQLARAIESPEQSIKIAHGPQIARDVVFFYAQKP